MEVFRNLLNYLTPPQNQRIGSNEKLKLLENQEKGESVPMKNTEFPEKQNLREKESQGQKNKGK